MRSFDIDVKLRVTVGEENPLAAVSPEELQKEVAGLLIAWSEGRYLFPVEMIHNGLEQVAAAAVNEALYQRARREFGAEMVPGAGGSSRSKAVLVAEDLGRGVSVRVQPIARFEESRDVRRDLVAVTEHDDLAKAPGGR